MYPLQRTSDERQTDVELHWNPAQGALVPLQFTSSLPSEQSRSLSQIHALGMHTLEATHWNWKEEHDDGRIVYSPMSET